MTPRLVHLSFASRSGIPVDLAAVRSMVETHAMDWANYASGSYILWTHLELAYWTSILRTIPNMESGYIFLCQIDPLAPVEGWLPDWAWQWIFKYRPHTPPPDAPRPNPPELGPLDFSGLFGITGKLDKP